MLEVKKVQKQKNMYSKQVEYKESVRLNSTAKTKEAIVSKYSESYQLNTLMDAVLKIAETVDVEVPQLAEIKRHIDEVRN